MPQSRLAGKRGEDAWTEALTAELRKRGLRAQAFPMFHIRKEGSRRLCKPDFEVSDGGVHVGSAKLGAKEFDAYKTADEYAELLPMAEELEGTVVGEVFAVTYPAREVEQFHLHILPKEGRHGELPFSLKSLEEVVDHILRAIRGEFAEIAARTEPITQEAPRILNYAAFELAESIKGIPQSHLEEVFGGHDFFRSVLATSLSRKRRPQALKLGPAFLFVNQVLFYTLLSRAGPDTYPPIAKEDRESPELIHERYFELVHSKNYEPIYRMNVAQFFKGRRAREGCASLVRVIQDMAPRLGLPDLAGQVFQTLIPFEIRKPLGAHYTNPKAAALLARLAIDTPSVKVMDPACGSGTLLVAAYRRKRELEGQADPIRLHHQFLEHDITGIDAMRFCAHLAAVNLALQQPLLETDHVRIDVRDSTPLQPRDMLTEVALPPSCVK